MAEPTTILETSDAVSKMNAETEKIEGDSIVMKISKKKTPIEAAREALAQKRKTSLSIDKPKKKHDAAPIIDETILEAVVSRVLSEKQRMKELKRQEEARHKEIELAKQREEQEKREKKAKKYEAIKRQAIEEYEASKSSVSRANVHVPPSVSSMIPTMDIRDKIRMLYK